MSGKEESFWLKPCSNGSMEAEEAASSLKPCNQKGGINGSTALSGAFIGKKQACSLKLCTAECLSMKGINGEQECPLKMCATKRKVLAGYQPTLKGGAIKRKGEEYCSEGDILSTAAVISQDVDKCADVAMVVEAASQKGAPGAGFSEEEDTGDVDFDWSTEEEDDNDDLQSVIDKADAKYIRFIERLLARNKTMPIKDYTAADFVDSNDEVVHDHAKAEVAL